MSPERVLADATSPTVGAEHGEILAVPLGATEQHGPHLPLGTDTAIAAALVAGLARKRTEVVTARALAYGASGEHAGFPGTVSIGCDALERHGRDVRAFFPRWSGDAHAGRAETALMLALLPGSVVLDRARAGVITPLPQLMSELRRRGVRAVSSNGVLGDPAGATSAEGVRLFAGALAQLCRCVRDWWTTA